MKQLFWGTILLCIAFSCSDDSGKLEDQSAEDRNFSVFTEVFEKFLETEASRNFTDGTAGLTFIGEQPCGVIQSTIFFNGQYINFNTTACYYYVNTEEDQYESFSIVNSKLLADGVTLYAVAAFLNVGIPQTGTYETNALCDLFCYSPVSVRVYYVTQQGQILSYYVSYPTSVDVVNNNGKVTTSFDTEFYSVIYPYGINAHGSGTISCCN